MRIITAIAALALVACGAEETLAPADYDPPSNYYAKAAFLEAPERSFLESNRIDLVWTPARRPVVVPGATPVLENGAGTLWRVARDEGR